MPDGTKNFKALELDEGFFRLLGRSLRKWKAISQDIAKAKLQQINDQQEFVEHYTRLRNTDTLLAFGYVVRSHERGMDRLPQADVVNALYDPDEDAEEDSTASDVSLPKLMTKSRESVRMDIGRRYKALHYFGLVERRQVTRTFVDLRLTSLGDDVNSQLDGILIQISSLEEQ